MAILNGRSSPNRTVVMLSGKSDAIGKLS